MIEKKSILVVIVNYQTPGLTIDALASLQAQRANMSDMQVVVTNAPAGDDSEQRITDAITERGWESWVTFKQLEHNGGFAYGNNAAIVPAIKSENPPAYVLLLNPDTVVREGAIASLYAFLESHPKAGL
ncbi:glycosyltransferase, partial [bacterium AH-315-I18]|nr:glycosyltransferase [bacterium AH-315-I18]